MWKFFKNLFLITGIILISTSCSELDLIKKGNQGYFLFGDKKFKIAQLLIQDEGNNGISVGKNFDIVFLSPGINYDQVNKTATGNGEILEIDLTSPSADELSSGKYTFSSTRAINRFIWGYLGLNLDFPDNGKDSDAFYTQIIGGFLEVSANEDKVDIDFRFETKDGRDIVGKYSGNFLRY